MASLAQYSAELHAAPSSACPAPGRAARWSGFAIYAGIAVLVVLAALQSA